MKSWRERYFVFLFALWCAAWITVAVLWHRGP